MAIKTPLHEISNSFLSRRFSIFIPSTLKGLSIPIISFNWLFQITSTFGFLNSLSWSIFSALKVSLL